MYQVYMQFKIGNGKPFTSAHVSNSELDDCEYFLQKNEHPKNK